MVVENWPMIAEKRRLGFSLTRLWRDLTKAEPDAGMTYKAFRLHVIQVAAAMENRPQDTAKAEPLAAPRGSEAVPTAPTSDPPYVSRKERFRLAREAREQEESAAAASPVPKHGKPDTSMIDGGETWMSNLGHVRVRELAALNLKFKAGEVSEADARPILEAARREGWSRRLGIRADQLTEEDMSGRWY